MKRIFLFAVILLACSACGSKTKEALYAEGVKQLEASNPAGAVVYFKNALEKDGNYNDARFQLGRAYAALGKLEQAEKELGKVLKQNPSRDEASLELARVLNEEGKGEEGSRLAGQYLAKHPQDAEGLEVLGLSSAVMKNYDDAERYLSQALNAAPRRSQTKLEMATIYSATGKRERAKGLVGEVMKSEPGNTKALYLLAALEQQDRNLDAAKAAYRQILQIKNSETVAQYKLGLIQIQKGELDQADASADDLTKRFPKKGEGPRLKGLVSFHRHKYADAITSLQASLKSAPTYEGYYFLGLSFYNQGELESALSQFRIILDRAPESRQPRLMTAQILLKQKRFDDAANEIRKVLQKDDADAVAHDLLGTTFMAQGLFDEGMRELNRATRLDPKLVSSHMKKGIYYLSKGKESDGESELTSAVQAAPEVLNNRLLLASHYQNQKRGDKAIAVLKSGLTGGKGDAPVYNALAALYLAAGNRAEGLKSLEKAKQVDAAFPGTYQNLAALHATSGDYGKAIAEYDAMLRTNPSSVRAMLGLAAMYELTGKDNEALAQYQKATQSRDVAAFMAKAAYHEKKAETDPALKTLDDALKVDARSVAVLEKKGRLLTGARRYQEALKVFDQVESLNQEQGVSLKIKAYLAMQDGAKAAAQARRLIEKSPRSAKPYLVLASVYQNQKDAASAEREAMNALRVDPASVDAHLFLGALAESQKAYDKAMSHYQNALKVRPDAVSAQFARGALLDRTGKKKEAVKVYRGILASADNYLPALNNLAYLCADGYGSKEEALRLAITAFRLDAGNAGVMDTVGYALVKNGRNADAVKVLERAVALMPREPSILYHLALAYKQSGDNVKAQQTLQKALTVGEGPDTDAARMLLASLKR